jgi:hypothetical protein
MYHVTTASVGKAVTEVTNPREGELCNERLSLGVAVVFITLTCHDGQDRGDYSKEKKTCVDLYIHRSRLGRRSDGR